MPEPKQITLHPLAVAQHQARSAEFWETEAKILRNDLLAATTELERMRAKYEAAPDPLKES